MRDTWPNFFKIVSNFTRLTTREITYNNFEISNAVFMHNITTNHAITYTNIGCLVCESFSVVILPFLLKKLNYIYIYISFIIIIIINIINRFFFRLRRKIVEFLGLVPTKVSSFFLALLAGFL